MKVTAILVSLTFVLAVADKAHNLNSLSYGVDLSNTRHKNESNRSGLRESVRGTLFATLPEASSELGLDDLWSALGTVNASLSTNRCLNATEGDTDDYVRLQNHLYHLTERMMKQHPLYDNPAIFERLQLNRTSGPNESSPLHGFLGPTVKVGFVVYDEFSPLDVAGPADLWLALRPTAGGACCNPSRDGSSRTLISLGDCQVTAGPFQFNITVGNDTVGNDCSPDSPDSTLDVLHIPGGEGWRAIARNNEWIGRLKNLVSSITAKRGVVIATGGGVALAVKAGALNNTKVATDVTDEDLRAYVDPGWPEVYNITRVHGARWVASAAAVSAQGGSGALDVTTFAMGHIIGRGNYSSAVDELESYVMGVENTAPYLSRGRSVEHQFETITPRPLDNVASPASVDSALHQLEKGYSQKVLRDASNQSEVEEFQNTLRAVTISALKECPTPSPAEPLLDGMPASSLDASRPLKLGAFLYPEITLMDFWGWATVVGAAKTLGAPLEAVIYSHPEHASTPSYLKTADLPNLWAHSQAMPDNLDDLIDVSTMPGGYFGPEQFINGPMKEEPFKTQFEQFYQRMLNDSSKIVTTVCSGGAVLANTSAIDNTSVIDNRTATTNKDSWAWIYYQADWFQKVGLKYEARWNRDSNLLTSSGVSSGMDAAMWLLENLYGHELRANVSKYLSFNDVYQSRRRNTEDEWRFAAWWSLPNTTQGHCEDWYAITKRGLCDPTCKERCQDWHANMTRDSCKERCKSVFVPELATSDQYAQQHGFDGKYSAFYYQVPLRHGNGNELLNGSLNKNQTEREGETISRCHKDCEQWYPDAAKLK